MCFAIIAIPFSCFYFLLYVISLTPDVTINSSSAFGNIKIMLKFFVITIVVTGIVDTIFSKVLNLKKGVWGFLSETLLMFAFFYLYIMLYSRFSNDILIEDKGYFYVSGFLLVLFLLIHVVYFISQKLYTKVVKNNRTT
jgi:hypothetical protein